MTGRHLVSTVGLSIVIAARFATPGHAQSPAPSVSPAPVSMPAAFTCPPASTSSGSVLQINVVPHGNSCWFDPRIVPDLETYVGGNGYWLFCSTCPFETRIELEGSDGPFGNFVSFDPSPDSDNLVKVTMPSNGYGHATGTHAKSEKSSKYDLTLRTPAGGAALDRIDPRLEIDDTFAHRWRILLLVGSLLSGGLVGGLVVRQWLGPKAE